MSVSVNCCEGMSIKKILCNCNMGAKKPQREQVLYTDRDEQIVILSTPHIEIPDLVVYDDIHRTDLVVFTLDPQGDVRFTSIQGHSLFRTVDQAPPPTNPAEPTTGPVPPLSARKDASQVRKDSSQFLRKDSTVREMKEHKVHPSIANPEDIAGRLLKDILPEYMLKFLLPICKQTLQGNFLQLTIMWGGLTQLVRTYPVQDYKKRIVAGMLTISPFVSAFNADINRFSVGSLTDQQQQPAFTAEKRPSKPEVQAMVLTSAGILRS